MMQPEVGTRVNGNTDLIGGIPCDIAVMQGKDSLDLLQRLSTNDLNGLSDGGIRKTLLLSDKGRVVDAVWVVRTGEALLLITSAGMVQTVTAFLERYIIMDDVIVSDASASKSVTMKFGHMAGGYQSDYFGHAATFFIHDHAGTEVTPSGEFERWRIEHGIPAAGKELVQDFNPLELDMWDWISFTKGCYIGQEVIARLDTYQKVQRSLCRFSSSGTAAEGSSVHDEEGTVIGKVTSVAEVKDGSIGLAVLRLPYAVPQQRLKAGEQYVPLIIEQVFRKEDHGRN